jgi:ferric-dicitrate binding protein FerR (iron transport regulator)
MLIAVALKTTSNTGERTNMTASVSSLEMRTGVGEQRTVDLSDGSRVILGATSTLRVAEGFGTTAREVTLEGQAFIRVRHDASRPFIVNAGGTRTVDLGTAFEVRAYPNEGVRVAVTEGLVEVRRSANAKDSTILQPGDVAELASGETVVRREQNVEQLLSWTRGELSFDDTPLSDVARELERWFDVQVRIEDPALRSLRWSATEVRIGESLDTILEALQGALSSEGLRAERNGNVITFRRGRPVNPTLVPTPRRNRVEAGA